MPWSASSVSSRSTEALHPVLQKALGYRFGQSGLLQQALSHRSRGNCNNERLEFLGDAVLNMVVAELLYKARPDVPEGDLSRLRARIVRERTLAEVARELKLGKHVLLGPGELKSGGFLRDSILADALEAVIGAVFLDGGFASAKSLVERLMAGRIAALPDAEALKDAKTRLQEWLQGRSLDLPDYEVVDVHGADHARQFTVVCRVAMLAEPIRATAGSRRRAEQAAALKALEEISRLERE
ncbi:MAG: ribonuclease III [Wenzhouxiangellaceae bacterium]|nr:ribonuclease III [Wenzhouxiangellaceae bacterium]